MTEEKKPKAKVELSPALAAAIQMSPAVAQACQENPELLVMLTRGQLALVQDAMARKALEDSDVSIAQLAVVHERLSKIARIEQTAAAGPGAGAPQVIINIIRGGGRPGVTIEGTASPAPELPAP